MRKYCLLASFVLAALNCYAAPASNVLSFYKTQSESLPTATKSDERAYASALADNLGTWILQHPSDANAPQVLLTQARLYLLAQDRARAFIALLKVHKMYPQTNLSAQQTSILESLQAVNEPQRALGRQAFSTRPGTDTTMAQREAEVLFSLSKLAGKTFYKPATETFESFFFRYPSYEKNDQVELWYGDLHRENNNYLAAISQYKKVAALYPNTPYRAASLRLIGDIYADQNDTANAMALYNQVLKEYPQSNEVGIVYKHMAILEENNKDYEPALIHYDKAIEALGTTPAAYEAYIGKADVYKKMKNFESAYASLQKTANAFIEDENKFMEPLLEAAQIAKRKLRDDVKYTQALEKALMVFPKGAKAPEVMYDLAQAYEQQGKSTQAINMYKKLVLTNPSGKYASKAQGRINKLGK